MTTETFTENYMSHRSFGGRIYEMDFETERRPDNSKNGSSIVHRIFSDWKFDYQCAQNIEGRKHRNQKEKENK